MGYNDSTPACLFWKGCFVWHHENQVAFKTIWKWSDTKGKFLISSLWSPGQKQKFWQGEKKKTLCSEKKEPNRMNVLNGSTLSGRFHLWRCHHNQNGEDYKSRLNGSNQNTAPKHKPIWSWYQMVRLKNNKALGPSFAESELSLKACLRPLLAVLARVVISGKVLRLVFVSPPGFYVVIASPFFPGADLHSLKVALILQQEALLLFLSPKMDPD